jgi:hypothetical protein
VGFGDENCESRIAPREGDSCAERLGARHPGMSKGMEIAHMNTRAKEYRRKYWII